MLASFGGAWAKESRVDFTDTRVDFTESRVDFTESRLALTDSVGIEFKRSKWDVDRSVGNNDSVLRSLDRRLNDIINDSIINIVNVRVYGGASPEGNDKINRLLSERRANAFFEYLSNQYPTLSDESKSFKYIGRDWDLLLQLAENDANLPYKDETISLLIEITKEKNATGKEPSNSLTRLKKLRGGEPERYLFNNIYPLVRTSRVAIDYEMREVNCESEETSIIQTEAEVSDSVEKSVADNNPISTEEFEQSTTSISTEEFEQSTTSEVLVSQPSKFSMDLRTNMLYDALALPNIGIDFHLGRNFTIGANWMYGWWSKRIKNLYWRAYGGELNAGWYFGKVAGKRRFSGHHIGVYGQYYLYDFQWRGKGEMSGKPGKGLWSNGLWAAGVEYGFSLPVAKRLNIDFTLGVGYTEGEYNTYRPIDNHDVWLETRNRRYFGPTKAEIALVWLIGNIDGR